MLAVLSFTGNFCVAMAITFDNSITANPIDFYVVCYSPIKSSVVWKGKEDLNKRTSLAVFVCVLRVCVMHSELYHIFGVRTSVIWPLEK